MPREARAGAALPELLRFQLEGGQLGHELGDDARDLRRVGRRLTIDLEAAGEAHALDRTHDGERCLRHGTAHGEESLHEDLDDVAHLG
eukprot:scaffold19369_cov38-Phaeocystis_antarctica.AAC.1